MANIISSAIVNTPPPEMMSDILNKRNKTHHLDPETDENMIPMFSHDVDGKVRNNKRLLPRRNWCSIKEYQPGSTPPPTPPPSEPGTPSDVTPPPPTRLQRTLSLTRDDVKPGTLIRRLSGRGPPSGEDYLRSAEHESISSPASPPRNDYFPQQSPTNRLSLAPARGDTPQRHISAPLPRTGNFLRRPTNTSGQANISGDVNDTSDHINLEHGLDVVLNCEVNQNNPAGITSPYRLLIPALFYEGQRDENTTSYTKPNLMQRITSLRGRRASRVASGQGQGNWGQDSISPTDSEGEVEIEKDEIVRPRRWSFGLEKRRRYRDQSPIQNRLSEDIRPSAQRNPSDEAQRLGIFQDRSGRYTQSQSQRQFEDRNQQIGRPGGSGQTGQQRNEVSRSRQVETFDGYDDYDYADEAPPRERLDSIDYHANIDTGKSAQSGGYPARKLSKVDRMLGARSGQGGSGNTNAMYEDEDQHLAEQRDLGSASKRTSGYSGIEAYSEKEGKGWRRSLKFF